MLIYLATSHNSITASKRTAIAFDDSKNSLFGETLAQSALEIYQKPPPRDSVLVEVTVKVFELWKHIAHHYLDIDFSVNEIL
jgi:hypothetical protein